MKLINASEGTVTSGELFILVFSGENVIVGERFGFPTERESIGGMYLTKACGGVLSSLLFNFYDQVGTFQLVFCIDECNFLSFVPTWNVFGCCLCLKHLPLS